MKLSFTDFDDVDLNEIPNRSHANRQIAHQVKRKKQTNPKTSLIPHETEETLSNANLTYNASRHEREWIIGSLSGFFEQQYFDDILRMVKGGKEASVYLCHTNAQHAPELIAAKVYRPRRFRSLKNDFIYQAGREHLDDTGHIMLDDGMQHAMRKKTEYGLQLLHTSWIEHEYQTLLSLHAAGADVPQPFARGNNAILMSYIGDEDMGAPTLNDVRLSRTEARPLFERVLFNIELMLTHNRIHGDLSAYNILYWEGKIILIDFPQVVIPEANPSSLKIFERDVARICEYFAQQGIQSNAQHIAHHLWEKFRHPLEPEVHPLYLDGDKEEDRKYWQKRHG